MNRQIKHIHAYCIKTHTNIHVLMLIIYIYIYKKFHDDIHVENLSVDPTFCHLGTCLIRYLSHILQQFLGGPLLLM